MLTKTHLGVRIARLRALSILSVPLTVSTLFLAHQGNLSVSQVLVLCAGAIAVVGGLTKVGST